MTDSIDLSATSTEDPQNRPPTAPEHFVLHMLGFDTEEHATQLANLIGTYVRELSRYINLAGLDGITIAANYNQALLDLDRGYVTWHKLTPSEEFAVGVAMTPSVIRDGNLKSHIVMNAGVALALEDSDGDNFSLAFHTLAHECAHVEITDTFNRIFPGILRQKVVDNVHDAFRWQVITASWDEYAATRLSAAYGQDPTKPYEETFILALNQTREKANNLIKAYRLHGDVNRIMAEVYGAYGELLKYAAYHLGNLAGRGLSPGDMPVTTDALSGHWFKPHFERLDEICGAIADDYGKWTNLDRFEALGDLADTVVADGGMTFQHLVKGQVYVDIPFTPETMPAA
jgi:hypothetical protein